MTANGYSVIKAGTGAEAIRLTYENRPDLVILDVMMPGIDGWQACRAIRETSDVPVIMLTGKRNSEEDVVRGLDCGADEYLAKPVGNHELLARVRAVLRRTETPAPANTHKNIGFSNDYLTIDINERNVTVNGKRIKLTPREFSLLALLVENSGHILSHQQVLSSVWGWEYTNDVDYVRIYISHLRQKIERDPSKPDYILTESGVGYYFSPKKNSV